MPEKICPIRMHAKCSADKYVFDKGRAVLKVDEHCIGAACMAYDPRSETCNVFSNAESTEARYFRASIDRLIAAIRGLASRL